jgi:hypothetical protein
MARGDESGKPMTKKPVLFAAACFGTAIPVGQGGPELAAMAAALWFASQRCRRQWPGVNGDSDETGFSHRKQITAANAGTLGLSCFLDLPGEAGLEASPSSRRRTPTILPGTRRA